MTILVKKVFISSKPTFVYLLCPPLCGPFSIQESAAGGLSYKAKKTSEYRIQMPLRLQPQADPAFFIRIPTVPAAIMTGPEYKIPASEQ